MSDIEILYEQDNCLVVNKPAGVLTQAPYGIDSLEVRVKAYLIEMAERSENCYLGLPHRLDRPVSGVILFGKNSRVTRRLSEQFEKRQIDKTYWAIVEGTVEQTSGTWVDYVRKVPNKPLAEIVPPINPDAREAILHFTVQRHFEFQGKPFTRLEIKLETGRMHQIRLQSSSHGYPILGDVTYGSTNLFGNKSDDERQRQVALHARSITFTNPTTQTSVNLTAPLPETWECYADK
ncbi:MAG: RluA family pseudouridine synthase [Planctomycetaceae bacterium]|jgi:RluA family pseudouridine synthase|nr:RluA family pseudouridine synthase [Planctomycetaceae bacterium]